MPYLTLPEPYLFSPEPYLPDAGGPLFTMTDTSLPPAFLLFVDTVDGFGWGADLFRARFREYHLTKARTRALLYLQTALTEDTRQYIGARRYQLARLDPRTGEIVIRERGDVLNADGRLISSPFETPAQLRPSS